MEILKNPNTPTCNHMHTHVLHLSRSNFNCSTVLFKTLKIKFKNLQITKINNIVYVFYKRFKQYYSLSYFSYNLSLHGLFCDQSNVVIATLNKSTNSTDFTHRMTSHFKVVVEIYGRYGSFPLCNLFINKHG